MRYRHRSFSAWVHPSHASDFRCLGIRDFDALIAALGLIAPVSGSRDLDCSYPVRLPSLAADCSSLGTLGLGVLALVLDLIDPGTDFGGLYCVFLVRYRHTFCLMQVHSALATDCSYLGAPGLGALDPVLGSINLVSNFKDLWWIFSVGHRHVSLVQVRPTLATDFCWLGAPGLCTLVLDLVLSLSSPVLRFRDLG